MVEFNELGQGYFTFKEFEENDIVKSFFDGYASKKVADAYKKRLYEVIEKHSRFNKYVHLDFITKISWNQEDYVFQVYYGTRDWYHYDHVKGEWF